MRNILISACLLGVACRYDGKSAAVPAAIKLKDKYNLIPVCPEILGGLPTPRLPCEIQNGRVIRSDSADMTAAYKRGAAETLKLAELFDCEIAVLKERSPSCGCGRVYDGSFSSLLTNGDGITSALLKQNGITVFGESEIYSISKGEV